MANVVDELALAVNADGVESGTRKAEAALNKLGQTVDNVAKKTGSMSKPLADTGGAANNAGKSFQFTAQRAQQLSFQLNDVVTGLLSGQRPFQILAQQGGQITQVFGGVGQTFRSLAGFLTGRGGVIVGLTALSAAMIGITASIESTTRSLNTIQLGLNATGRGSEATRQNLRQLIQDISDLPGVSRDASQAMVRSFSSSGGVSVALFKDLADAATGFARVTGKEIPDAAASLQNSLKDPISGAKSLNEQFNLFDVAALQNIKTLQDHGKVAEAQAVIVAALGEKFGSAKIPVTELEKATDDFGNALDNLKKNVADSSWIDDFSKRVAQGAAGVVQITANAFKSIENLYKYGTADINFKPVDPNDAYRNRAKPVGGANTPAPANSNQPTAAPGSTDNGKAANEQFEKALKLQEEALQKAKALAAQRAADIKSYHELTDTLDAQTKGFLDVAAAYGENYAAVEKQDAANEALTQSIKNQAVNVADLTEKILANKKAREAQSYAEETRSANEQVELAQLNLSLVGQTADVREREMAIAEKRLDIEKQFPLLSQDERDALLATYQTQISMTAEANRLNEIYDDVVDTLTDNFKDMLDGQKHGLEGFADSIFDTFKQTFAKIAAQAATTSIVMPIMTAVLGSGITGGAGSAAGGGGGGFGLGGLSNLAGMGNSLSSIFGGVGSGSMLNGFGAQLGFGNSFNAATGAWTSGFTSASLGSVLGAAGLGYAGGSLLAGLVGGNKMGGGIGGGIGATAGMLIGGPVGALIGGVGGSLIGGMFGPGESSAKAQAVYDFSTDSIVQQNTKKASKSTGGKLKTGLDQIASLVNLIEEATGQQATGTVGLNVTTRYATKLDINGQRVAEGKKNNIDWLADAFAENADKLFTGLNADLEEILNKGGKFDDLTASITAYIAKIQARDALNQMVGDAILQITDPKQYEFDMLDRQFDEYRQTAKDTGADLVKLEELYGLQRQQIVEKYADQTATILQQKLAEAGANLRQYLDNQLLGETSNLSPDQKLVEAQRQFDELLTKARGSDADALANITQAADSLINIGKDYYGSDANSAALTSFVRASLESLGSQLNLDGFSQANSNIQAAIAATANSQLVEIQGMRAELANIAALLAGQNARLAYGA